MKRIFKFLGKGLLTLLGLLLIMFSLFRVTEHLKGNNFIPYLESNIESSPNPEDLSFEMMTEDIKKSKLILVGEIHGFQDATKFDPVFFSFLRKEFNVKHFLVEMDFAQAHYLNVYNKTGNEQLLEEVLSKWVVRIGRESVDYKNKFKKLRQIYLSKGEFTYYGNNNISDIHLVRRFCNEVLNQTFSLESKENDSIKLIETQEKFIRSQVPTNLTWLADYVLKNIEYSITEKYREEILTENLIALYDRYNLSNEMVYGSYGLGHTVLAPFESGYKSMAARFAEIKPDFKDEILSTNFVFLDSKMAIHSNALPSFMQDEGYYTNVNVSYDNIFMSYLFGIDDLRRVTDEKSFNLIKLNGIDSPYNHSKRLTSMFKILPFGQVVNAGENNVTSDYYDYLILVRNSDGLRF